MNLYMLQDFFNGAAWLCPLLMHSCTAVRCQKFLSDYNYPTAACLPRNALPGATCSWSLMPGGSQFSMCKLLWCPISIYLAEVHPAIYSYTKPYPSIPSKPILSCPIPPHPTKRRTAPYWTRKQYMSTWHEGIESSTCPDAQGSLSVSFRVNWHPKKQISGASTLRKQLSLALQSLDEVLCPVSSQSTVSPILLARPTFYAFLQITCFATRRQNSQEARQVLSLHFCCSER